MGAVGDVVLNAANASRVYAVGRSAGTGNQGVMTFWKSTNGGKDWSSAQIAAGPSSGQAMAIESGNDAVIYAGGVRDYNKPILLKSVNGGTTWTALGQGMIAGQVLDLAVHPTSPLRVLAGTSEGLYVSADGGASWDKAFNGETREILFDPSLPSDIYAAGATGIWRSRDFGGSWEAFGADLDFPSLLSLAVNWTQRIFYAGTAGNSVKRKKFAASSFLYQPVGLIAAKLEVRSVLQREYVAELKWTNDPRNTDLAKYRVYLLTEGKRTLLGEVDAGTGRFLHRKLAHGMIYFYCVTSIDRSGREGGSAVVSLSFN